METIIVTRGEAKDFTSALQVAVNKPLAEGQKARILHKIHPGAKGWRIVFEVQR